MRQGLAKSAARTAQSGPVDQTSASQKERTGSCPNTRLPRQEHQWRQTGERTSASLLSASPGVPAAAHSRDRIRSKGQSDQLRGCLTPGSLHQEADASKNARDGCPSSRIKCNLCSLLQSAPGQEPFGLGLQNACSLLRSPGGHSLASASLKIACRKAFAGPAQGQCRCPDPAGHRHCDLSDSGTCCQETVTASGRGHWRSRRPPRPASRCGYCPPCQSAGNRA